MSQAQSHLSLSLSSTRRSLTNRCYKPPGTLFHISNHLASIRVSMKKVVLSIQTYSCLILGGIASLSNISQESLPTVFHKETLYPPPNPKTATKKDTCCFRDSLFPAGKGHTIASFPRDLGPTWSKPSSSSPLSLQLPQGVVPAQGKFHAFTHH